MLEGDLCDFTLPDILRLLAVTGKTGRLRLEDRGETGRIDVVGGLVEDASADAARLPLARRLLGLGILDETGLRDLVEDGALPSDLEFAWAVIRTGAADTGRVTAVLREQTVDALFDLLRWSAGSFRFDILEPAEAAPPQLDLAVDDLLDEVEQRLAEWPQIESRTGVADAVVSIGRPVDGPGQEIQIAPEGWSLLRYVDGRRTVAELVALSGRGQFDTRRTLGALVDSGVVRIGDAGADNDVQRLLDAHRMLADLEAAHGGAANPAPLPAVPAPTEKAAEEAAPASVAAPAPVAGPPPVAEPELPAPGSAPSEDPAAAQHLDGEATPAEPAVEGVTPLRTRVRPTRLTTDPSVDADLVNRLIEGVEGL